MFGDAKMGMHDSLMGRWNFFRGLFNFGQRDLYKTFGYATDPSFEMRLAKYLRQDLAARVVDAPAAALWTNPPQVTSTDEAWNTSWNDLVARHDLWAILERLDKLAGIGRYAIMIIGFNDGQPLDKPIDKRRLANNVEKILYLQPYSEQSARIETYNQNTKSENFNKPETYIIQPDLEKALGFDKTARDKKSSLGSFRVHASRVLHIAENTLENDVFGSPRLERVYNLLDDLLKVVGGSAETYWLTSNRGMHVDIDKDMNIDPQDGKDLSAEIDEYANGLRRFIRTRGVKVNNLGGDVSDPKPTYGVLIASLSGATGIPQRILIGSEAGQLASAQDRANWADRIDERRAGFANPMVLHKLIKLLTAARYLQAKRETAITIAWPTAFKLSPLEAAQTSAQHARSATNFAKAITEMENLKRGEPGSEEQIDPATGKAIPGSGTAATPGLNIPDLVTVDEARKMIGLDKPPVTFDSGEDVGSTSETKPVPQKKRRKAK